MASINRVGNDVDSLIKALEDAVKSGKAANVQTVSDKIEMAGGNPPCALSAAECASAREVLGMVIDSAKEKFPSVRWGEISAPAPAVSRESARTMEFADEHGGEIIFGTDDAALDTPAPAAPRPTVVVRKPRPAAAAVPAPAARVVVLDEGAGDSFRTVGAPPSRGGSVSATTSTYNPNRISLGFGAALPFTGVKMYATDYEANVPYEFNYAGAGQDDVTKGSISKVDLNYKRLLTELAPNSGWFLALGGKLSVLGGSVNLPWVDVTVGGGTISGIDVDDGSLDLIDEIRNESGAARWAVSAWTVGPTLTFTFKEYFEAQIGLGFGNYTRTAKDTDADFNYGTSDDLTAGDFNKKALAFHPELAVRGILPLGDKLFLCAEMAVGAVIPLKDTQTRSEYSYTTDSTIFYFSPSVCAGVRF